jgi:hypothetical protein
VLLEIALPELLERDVLALGLAIGLAIGRSRAQRSDGGCEDTEGEEKAPRSSRKKRHEGFRAWSPRERWALPIADASDCQGPKVERIGSRVKQEIRSAVFRSGSSVGRSKTWDNARPFRTEGRP